MKARKFPGVRCSTLKTECRSLLCLMIMPGRSCVAGMAIAKLLSLRYLRLAEGTRQPQLPVWANLCILYGLFEFGNRPSIGFSRAAACKILPRSRQQTAKMAGYESKL